MSGYFALIDSLRPLRLVRHFIKRLRPSVQGRKRPKRQSGPHPNGATVELAVSYDNQGSTIIFYSIHIESPPVITLLTRTIEPVSMELGYFQARSR